MTDILNLQNTVNAIKYMNPVEYSKSFIPPGIKMGTMGLSTKK